MPEGLAKRSVGYKLAGGAVDLEVEDVEIREGRSLFGLLGLEGCPARTNSYLKITFLRL